MGLTRALNAPPLQRGEGQSAAGLTCILGLLIHVWYTRLVLFLLNKILQLKQICLSSVFSVIFFNLFTWRDVLTSRTLRNYGRAQRNDQTTRRHLTATLAVSDYAPAHNIFDVYPSLQNASRSSPYSHC